MDTRRARTISTLLRLKPDLLQLNKSEEGVNQLVMAGKLDFNTGMDLIERMKSMTSTEGENIGEGDDKTIKNFTSRINFPKQDETVVGSAIYELASDDAKEKFKSLLDQVMKWFETEGNKMHSELSAAAKDIVAIDASDVSVAEKLAEQIKSNQYVFLSVL